MQRETLVLRSAVGGLVVASALLFWWLTVERRHSDDQHTQIQELKSRLNDRLNRERLEFQEKCALQAEKVFKALGYNLQADSLQSHYHPERNRCFMQVAAFPKSNPDGSIFTFKFLLDAYEQRSLAEYAWRSHKDKKYTEVPPVMCKFTEPGKPEVACNSDEAFEQFVAKYMQ